MVFLVPLAAAAAAAGAVALLVDRDCLFGDPAESVTVGPTDCERPLWVPFGIFLGLPFCGLDFCGLS